MFSWRGLAARMANDLSILCEMQLVEMKISGGGKMMEERELLPWQLPTTPLPFDNFGIISSFI